MLPSWWTEQVTFLAAPLVTDEYGTPGTERDWANAVPTVVEGCSVQPVQGSEYDQGREALTVRWRVYAPAGTVVTGDMRATYRGDTYDVDGDGQAWPSATGALDHVQVLLERSRG